MGNELKGARILGGSKLVAQKSGGNVVIALPAGSHSDIDTVVELTVAGKPVVFKSPTIETGTPGFVSSIDVPIKVATGMTVRYTTDGSPVRASSVAYTKPIHITQPLTISAAGFFNGKLVTGTVTKHFDKLTPWPATKTPAGTAGLDVQEYQGAFNSVSEFLEKVPSKLLTASQVGLDPAWKVAPERIGRIYSGTLVAPKSSLYQFELRSDDGSRLWIDGKVVVDNDGLHAPADKSGFAPLEKGAHTIKVAWFNNSGNAALGLKWTTGSSNPVSIPTSAFRH